MNKVIKLPIQYSYFIVDIATQEFILLDKASGGYAVRVKEIASAHSFSDSEAALDYLALNLRSQTTLKNCIVIECSDIIATPVNILDWADACRLLIEGKQVVPIGIARYIFDGGTAKDMRLVLSSNKTKWISDEHPGLSIPLELDEELILAKWSEYIPKEQANG